MLELYYFVNNISFVKSFFFVFEFDAIIVDHAAMSLSTRQFQRKNTSKLMACSSSMRSTRPASKPNGAMKTASTLDLRQLFKELADVFPSCVHTVRRLPMRCHKYKLWHDPDVSFNGQRLHVKLASVKDVGSAVRKAMVHTRT